MEKEIDIDLRPAPGTRERKEYDSWERKVLLQLARMRELDREKEIQELVNTNSIDAIMHLRGLVGTEFDDLFHKIARRIGQTRLTKTT